MKFPFVVFNAHKEIESKQQSQTKHHCPPPHCHDHRLSKGNLSRKREKGTGVVKGQFVMT